MTRTPRSHLAGTGRHLPDSVLSNEEVGRLAGVTPDWVVRRTGIRQRRVAGPETGTAAMGAGAAAAALESADADPSEVGLLVVATSTPDHLTPPTACEIQAQLGALRAAAFDIEAGFAGWIYAFIIADAALRAGLADTALVVGVDKLSTVTDRANPATGPLFGDGAGAAVLRRGSGPLSVEATSWWADGNLATALQRPGGGARQPFDERVLEERSHLLRMEGTRLFRPAVRTMADQARRALAVAGLATADVGLVVPHQANLRILEALARELRLTRERLYINIDRYGNTGAATVPIALDEALRNGELSPAGPILLVAFGAGATAGAAVLGPGRGDRD